LYESLKDVFTTERYRIQNGANYGKKAIQPRGTRLVKDESVKERFSYRNITLAVGICVALIVALTLWAQRKRSTFTVANHVTTIISQVAQGPSLLDLFRKTSKVDY
jgi:sensor domain CHASE-containing protein